MPDENPKGFFELRALKELNERVLAKLGGDWQATPPRPPAWERAAGFDELRADAERLVTVLGATERVAVVKDPRFSLTLPFWLQVTELGGVLVALRHPSEVAASLARRNDMDAHTAGLLWLEYTSAALTQHPRTALVPYTQLLSASRETACDLADFLGLPAPDDGALAEVGRFVEGGLRHHVASEAPAAELASAAWLHDWLLEQTAPAASANGTPRVRTARPDAQLLQIVADATATRDGIRRTEDAIRLQRDIERLTAKLAKADEHVGQLRSTIEKRDVQLSTLRDGHDVLADRLVAFGEVTAELAAAEKRSEVLVERMTAVEATLASVEQARDSAWQDVKELRANLRSVQQRLQRAEHRNQRLQRAEQRHQRLRDRRIVRFALAVASLARPLFRLARRVRRLAVRNRSRPAEVSPRPSDKSRSVAFTDDAAKRSDDLGTTLLAAARRAAAADVAVLIPVYDAPGEVRRCLASVRRNTSTATRLLIIDDGSQSPETLELLADVATWPNTTVLRNEENLGFTRTVNRGLAHATGDVVLLNSDTIVPPRWVQGLQLAAYSGERVGSATAVSDDAGAFAMPDAGQRNPVPPVLDDDGIGRAAATASDWDLLRTPTMHGFCVYLRRDMLDEVGLLDAEAFPRGYGEENDLSMRAAEHGWEHVLADAVFVRHTKGTSFGSERDGLIRAGRAFIDQRHPTYTQQVRDFLAGEPIAALRTRYAQRWATVEARDGRPTVLVVLHDGSGGTPQTTLDLATGLSDRWRTLVLVSSAAEYRLSEVLDGRHVPISEHAIDPPIRFMEGNRDDVAALVAELCVRHGVELVHSRHLIGHTVDVLDTPRLLGIPTVVSLHDYYTACPTVQLLDEQERFCGAVCTEGPGPCVPQSAWITRDAPPLKHDGVYEWRAHVGPRLVAADALVTTSGAARDVLRTAFHDLPDGAITVIEHGRDIELQPSSMNPPAPGEPIRLLLPGNLGPHKGVGFVRELLAHDTGGRIELHLLGKVRNQDRDLGIVHGTYRRSEFLDRVAEIAPHMIGIFSIWAETYSHTLTEAWATGVPVVATDIGAVAERIRNHGGGVLVPLDDPAAALQAMLDLADHRDAYTAAAGPRPRAVRSISQMSADYMQLYADVLEARRPLGRPTTPRRAATLAVPSESTFLEGLRASAVMADPGLDVRRTTPRASTDDRPVIAIGAAAAAGASVRDLLDPTALPPDDEVDTALTTPWRPTLLAAASTTQLSFTLAGDLWFGQLASDAPVEPQPPAPVGAMRLLAVTHVGPEVPDLDLIEEVVRRLSSTDRPVRLTIIDLGNRLGPANWYARRTLPPTDFDDQVRWLRRLALQHDAGLVPPAVQAHASDLPHLVLAALGLATVVPDDEAFAGAVDGQTALVCPTDGAGAWVAALEMLSDSEVRSRISSLAMSDVRRKRTDTTAWSSLLARVTDAELV